MKHLCLGALLWLVSAAAVAEDLYMVRSSLSFPEAMAVLQQSIRDHGLTLSRVQRVDIGLTTFGYETDKYRVVFFGKLNEIRTVGEQYPELLPHLPQKIAIFAEGEETILLSSSFTHLRPFYTSASMQARFDAWEKATRSILEVVRNAD